MIEREKVKSNEKKSTRLGRKKEKWWGIRKKEKDEDSSMDSCELLSGIGVLMPVSQRFKEKKA